MQQSSRPVPAIQYGDWVFWSDKVKRICAGAQNRGLHGFDWKGEITNGKIGKQSLICAIASSTPAGLWDRKSSSSTSMIRAYASGSMLMFEAGDRTSHLYEVA